MHPSTYLTVFVAAVSAATVPEANNEKRQNCPPVQIIAAPGAQTTQGDLGYLQSTIDAIQAQAQQSEVFQIAYAPGVDDPTAIADGIPALRNQIQSFSAQCPNSRIVTVGYSIGATIVQNVLCGAAVGGADELSDDFRSNIVANIIYGDPTYVPGLRTQAGSCNSGSGRVPRQFPGKCYPFGRKTKSYCDEGDDVCCGGDDTSVHFTYPAKYDQDAANWVRAKLTYWRNNRQNAP